LALLTREIVLSSTLNLVTHVIYIADLNTRAIQIPIFFSSFHFNQTKLDWFSNGKKKMAGENVPFSAAIFSYSIPVCVLQISNFCFSDAWFQLKLTI
jgi:hypothetical protein